jgi:hypothetical protein
LTFVVDGVVRIWDNLIIETQTKAKQMTKTIETTEHVRKAYNITEEMVEAGWKAEGEYQALIDNNIYPRPLKVVFIFERMMAARREGND